MAQGFIKNKTQPTVNDAAWSGAIELTGTVSTDAGHDANSRPLPSAGHLSHMDIIFTGGGGAPSVTTPFDIRITYDEAGKDPVLPPLAGQRIKNSRVAGSKHTVLGIDSTNHSFTVPATNLRTDGSSAAGSLFVQFNPNTSDGSTTTIDTVRLHWNDKL